MVEESDDLIVEVQPNKGKFHLVILVELEQSKLSQGFVFDSKLRFDQTQDSFLLLIVFELNALDKSGEVVGPIGELLL